MSDHAIKKAFEAGGLRSFLPLIKASEPPTSCRIRAKNDIEAIERWLEEYFEKPTTYRAYKKEAERFLVWCMVVEHISLSELDRDHVDAYLAFLRNPEPKEQWCGPKSRKNSPNAWRPFRGPLSDGAIHTAITVINSLMNYLIDAGYLTSNPFNLVRRKSRFKNKLNERRLMLHERILSNDEWRMMVTTMESAEVTADTAKKEKARLIFMVNLLFFLGLRIDELARSRYHNFKNIHDKWWFFVVGKGDKLGKVPVNRSLLHAMMMYRSASGFSPLPSNEDIPLIASLKDPNKPLTTRQMSNLLKDLGKRTVEKYGLVGLKRDRMLKFSPHWLRHLSASMQDQLGFSITHIRENLRHENEQTTRQYIHATDEARHREMEKMHMER